MSKVDLSGRVAIITGAGGGLGRTHALLMAKCGASIVVNDLGGAADGTGKGTAMADKVVEEIKQAGGKAVADYNSVATVAEGKAIVETALKEFGKIDIVVNNAGILRDKSFANMEEDMWDAVIAVHLKGAYCVTRPAFQKMKEQAYGRIIMTSSASGIFGNFGQTNYGAAKMGQIGMMNVIEHEGAKYNIKVNTIAPVAITRMTEDLMQAVPGEALQPEFVSPLVAYLASEQCTFSGNIFSVGGGFYARNYIAQGEGFFQNPQKEPVTPETIADHIDEILDTEAKYIHDQAQDDTMRVFQKAQSS